MRRVVYDRDQTLTQVSVSVRVGPSRWSSSQASFNEVVLRAHAQVDHLDEYRKAHREVDVPLGDVEAWASIDLVSHDASQLEVLSSIRSGPRQCYGLNNSAMTRPHGCGRSGSARYW